MAMASLHLIEQRVQVGKTRDIRTNGERARADLVYGGIQLGRAATGDDDRSALRHEALRDAETDAGAAAGDHGDLAVEGSCHGSAPSVDAARRVRLLP